MKVSIKHIWIAICALIISACDRVAPHTVTCRVYSIDKQVVHSGDKEHLYTDIYWLVTTDNGTYHIVTDGLWACPEAVGLIKVDSVYTFTVDGFYQSSYWGVYPYIVGVSKYDSDLPSRK